MPCDCRRQIYGVPVRSHNQSEEIIWFDKLEWPWAAHFCPDHNELPGVADISPKNLGEQCRKLKLPEPYRLVSLICVDDRIRGPEGLVTSKTPACSPVCRMKISGEQLYSIALTSSFGEPVCSFFRGKNPPRWGDLAALCGTGPEQKLLTNENQVLNFDGESEPWRLGLSLHARLAAGVCSACRRKLAEVQVEE